MSSEADDLQASIDVYTTQLQQVNDAIAQCNSDAERESLHNLRADLSELLLLTRQSLGDDQQQPVAADADDATTTTHTTDATMDAEFNQFLQEIREVESNRQTAAVDVEEATEDRAAETETTDSPESAQQLHRIKAELSAKLGDKCSAPHTHSWGARAYHNAMICGLDDRTEYASMPTDSRQLANVLVLFTNPTHREMLPCPYYLDGECRFAADQCHYSHGELVAVAELRAFRQPDYALLERRRNWPVLVRRPDRMWHRGVALAVASTDTATSAASDERTRTCRVRLDATRKELEVDYADVMPMHRDRASAEDSSEDDETDDDDDDDDSAHSSVGDAEANSNGDEAEAAAVARHNRAALVERSLLQPAADRPLGEWERHTRGFGSRMMQKYGYVLGTGLGSGGAGIVVPISAEVLPPGKSLDYCMALREQAGGDRDLFSAERRRKQLERKRELGQERAYERERKRNSEGGDVFRFMNDSLRRGVAGAAGQSKGAAVAATSTTTPGRLAASGAGLREHTTKALNVVGYQLGEDIRRQEAEQQRLREAMRRHSAGSAVHSRLGAQLAEIETVVQRLRQQEAGVKREQSSRKEQSKLTVF